MAAASKTVRWWNPATWFRSGVEALALPEPVTTSTLTPADRAALLRYDAAKRDNYTHSWLAGDGDAASEIGPDIARVRQRAREAERNRGIAARVLDVYVSSVVGKVGGRPRFRVTSPTGQSLPDAEQALALAWRAWSREASASDRSTFEALQALAFRSVVRDGEVVLRMRPRRLEDMQTVPLQLEVLEADHIDTSKTTELDNGGRIVNGVELSPIGRVVAYWLYRRHPGDRSGIGTLESVRIPAESLVHPFLATRAGQLRGVSWLAPVLDAIWHHSSLRQSERVRFRASASTFATTEGATDDAGDDGVNPVEPSDGEEAGPSGYVEDAYGQPVNQITPAQILNVTHGKALKLHVPQAAIGYADAIRVEERDIARGVGLMYEALSGDLSAVNWASFRVGDVRFRAGVDMGRVHMLEPLMLDPIAKEWLRLGLASGRLSVPPGATVSTEWRWAPHEEMDREASAKADVAEMRSGGVSFEQFCERRGTTMQEQIESLARSLDALRVAGVLLDGIPAQTTSSGQAQAG